MKRLSFILLIFCLNLTTMYAQKDQGITSDVHQKYVGKIVFSSDISAMSLRKEKPSAFKNSFKASDVINARAYVSKSIANTLHGGQKSYNAILMYDLYIDGKKIQHKKSFGMYKHVPENERTLFTESLIKQQEKFNTWTSWRPYLLPAEDNAELKYGNVNISARAFALALLDQEVGTHEIELKVYSRDFQSSNKTDVLAAGSFTIELSKEDKRILAFKYAPPLPKDEWKGGNKAALLKELEGAFTKEIRQTPILVGFYGQDWNEGTYTLTGQKYRKVAGWAVFDDDSDGDGQVPITTFNWVSDYSNGGWTKMRFDSHCNGCPDWKVEVDAVKLFKEN